MSRDAVPADLDAIEVMAREYYRAFDVPWPYDGGAVKRFIAAMIGADNAVVIVSDAGFLVGVKQPHPVSPRWIVASEVMWWGDAGLIRRFRKWASDADEVRYSCPPAAKAQKMFARRGNVSETVFSEVL